MPSDVQIVNMALRRLRVSPITSIGEDSEPGAWASAVYAACRDEVLVGHAWNFAVKRASLAADPTAPAWGYDYRYTLPTDCLRVWRLDGELEGIAGPYRVEGRYILTDDSAPLLIEYISQATDAGIYPPLFVNALVARLALEGAYGLTGSGTREGDLRGAYFQAMADARRADSQEGTPEDFNANQWIEARL